MCFSASASFTAGIALTGMGIATEMKVSQPNQRIFATIPFLFGIQQIAEGFVWLSLQRADQLVMEHISTYIFLFAADILWPIFIPLSCFWMEENPQKKKILRSLVLAGTALSLYYAVCLLTIKVKPEILNCHINYSGEFPRMLVIPAFLLYLLVTITPFFISSVKGMIWLGILLFAGCLVSVILYLENVTSVWCFFAALVSLGIFQVLRIRKSSKHGN